MNYTNNGFLVVGGGKMGLSHLAILNRLLEPGQVAVVDPSRLTRFLFARMGLRTFASLDAALASKDRWVGAVVATPTASHLPIARALLERGVACFVEKPLTLDPAASSALVALQRRQAVVAQMGFVLRFVQPFVRLRDIVRSGVLGAPLTYRAQMLGNVVTRPDPHGGWRTDFKRGGGCLNEYGPHLFDLCRAIFGEVQRIDKAEFGRVHSTRGDDRSAIHWQHANGLEGALRLDWCDSSQRKSYTDFDVRFEHGLVHANTAQIRIEPDANAPLDDAQRQLLAAPALPFPVNFYLRGEEFSLQLELFVERVLGRPMLRANIQHDLAAQLDDGRAVDQLIADAAAMGGLA